MKKRNLWALALAVLLMMGTLCSLIGCAEEAEVLPETTQQTETVEDDSAPDSASEIQSDLPLDISQGSVPFEDQLSPDTSVYMMEMKTGTIIHARNENEKRYPASLTKIMTCILALENIPDLSVKITYKSYIQNIVYEMNKEAGWGISLGGLMAGDELTAEQLLYGLMLPSANEIAVILADYIGNGDLDAFYQMMNDKAAELGCQNTHFSNCNGLFDEENYTTAYDMALITQYAMQNETFREIVSTTQYDVKIDDSRNNLSQNHPGEETLSFITTNPLLKQSSGSLYRPEVIGVKTGSLEEAGRCLVSVAQKDGYEYLLVVMNAPYEDANSAAQYSCWFYDWAFETFRAKTIVEKGSYIHSINDVRLAKDGKDHLTLMSGQTFTALLPSNIEVDNVRRIAYDLNGNKMTSDNYIEAPVKKGEVLGKLYLMLYGQKLGEVDMLAAEDIEASPLLVTLDKIAGFFSSFAFKFVFLFVLFVVVLYLGLLLVKNREKKRYRKMNRRRRF